MDAAFIPEVNDDLDTQNFEKFEEVQMLFNFCGLCEANFVKHIMLLLSLFILIFGLQADNQAQSSSKTGPWRKVSF